MGVKGRTGKRYDAKPMQRLRLDEAAIRKIRVSISEHLQAALEEAAADLEEYDIEPAAAELFVAQETVAAVEFFRWLKAGQARAAGVTVRGMMDAMNYGSQTSLTRFIDTIDLIAGEQARANDSETVRPLTDQGGYTFQVAPVPGGMTLHEATRRGHVELDPDAA